MNIEKYFEESGEVREQALAENLWLKYLVETDNIYVNAERVDSMVNISGRETIEYVMRTLDILDEDKKSLLNAQEYEIVQEVLKWSEVAKGGTSKERKEWLRKGYLLDIHNEGSAEIYREAGRDTGKVNELIYLLIKTHGLIWQAIRGEVPVANNRILRETLSMLEPDSIHKLLKVLNHCIIAAVDPAIWEAVKEEVCACIDRILQGDDTEYSAGYRLGRLLPDAKPDEGDLAFFEQKVFPGHELWYFSSALASFDMKQIVKILDKAMQSHAMEEIRHINFKPLADSLYYDYEGRKHINVYKKRIIEKYLRDDSIQNVELTAEVVHNTLYIDFQFTRVCEKLIDFCVEAERCGMLTYEKSIVVLYDMFGFRKDAFDRLNNEDKYLSTMNDTAASTKNTIIEYVVGDRVADVGSGGGILLDKLEERYPDKQITGTDIASNVIDELNLKRQREGHHWNVCVHNFVDGPMQEQQDSIIFSSILHEIYSYTEGPNGKFDLQSVYHALKNAYDSLRVGGRLIIRDGIKTDSRERRMLRFKSSYGYDFFENYCKDFQGLNDLTEAEKVVSRDRDTLTIVGDVNFLREFLYTFTWGSESYAHEVQEQFGYMTIEEFRSFFASLNMKIIRLDSFFEQGYQDNLSKYVDVLDENGAPVDYPDSNCILVVEKTE
ncbi:MAG: methyltransferase [Lachnospiraceae bacterium]|nr:methyltransferase [Lachnospiraceae bacterium]